MNDLHAQVYMNWGRWVADCPRPGCGNAEHFGTDPGAGHVGGLTGSTFVCGSAGHGCGLRCRAEWPGNVADIEAMLAARPVPKRNWLPGENLHALLAENLEHGIVPINPDALEDGPTRVLLGLLDNEVIAGALGPGLRPAVGVS